MKCDDLEAQNSYGNDTLIMPAQTEDYTFENGELSIRIKPLSWNVYVFEKA